MGQAKCERDLELLDLTLNDGDTFAYVPVAPCAKSNQQKIDPSHRCAIVGVTNRRCEARSTEPPLRRSTRPPLKRTGNAASTIGVPSSTSPKERLDPRSVCRTRERRRSPSMPVSPKHFLTRHGWVAFPYTALSFLSVLGTVPGRLLALTFEASSQPPFDKQGRGLSCHEA